MSDALIALCENRIAGLSRARQAFEQTAAPEQVGWLVGGLRGAAVGWDEVVGRGPEGDPVALRVGARGLRDGSPAFAAVADVLDTYAAALESAQARHATGLAHLRAAQGAASTLPLGGGDRPPGPGAPPRDTGAETTAEAALAVLDAACAGFAACQDAYVAVRDAERALYGALSHVRVRPPVRGAGARA
ncbi:MAG TPA: hypothetical protein VKY86_10790 [Promicromonospora sp.]|nr:hypothetical protein [Promicromonospora sp.]